MKILVIGNGFDLAHGHKTKYKDFIDYVEQFNMFYDVNNINGEDPIRGGNFMNYIIDFFKDRDQVISELINEFHRITKDNIWIKHFNNIMYSCNENWVDFEKEISKVVRWMEEKFEDCIKENEFKKFQDHIKSEDLNSEKKVFITDLLLDIDKYNFLEKFELEKINIYSKHLDDLIRAFEIYLMTYVDSTLGENLNEDILNLNLREDDALISFNYTDTYNKLYKNNQIKKENVHFIHGMAKLKNTSETNNMVLGIDDYHEGEDRNQKVKYLRFNKYFQRIVKGTDASYKDLFRDNHDLGREKLDVYFFGHSLDVTDKDILKEIFENEDAKITVFSYDIKTQQQQVNNLVQVLGRDQVISSAYDSEPKIRFKIQSKEKEKNFKEKFRY